MEKPTPCAQDSPLFAELSVRVGSSWRRLPRVARSSQPWAGCRHPFRVERPRADTQREGYATAARSKGRTSPERPSFRNAASRILQRRFAISDSLERTFKGVDEFDMWLGIWNLRFEISKVGNGSLSKAHWWFCTRAVNNGGGRFGDCPRWAKPNEVFGPFPSEACWRNNAL